jgi:hypothetical protein
MNRIMHPDGRPRGIDPDRDAARESARDGLTAAARDARRSLELWLSLR